MKPHQLMWMEEPGYRFIGEVMSFPFLRADGKASVMVRRIPGCPGTLEERAVGGLNPVTPRGRRFVHYAKIAGRSEFPLDMLRYDCCAPMNFVINQNPESGFLYAAIDLDAGLSDLIVGRILETRYGAWTPSRWASFGWSCEPIYMEEWK